MGWLKLLTLLLAFSGVEAGVVTIPLTNDHNLIYRGKVHIGKPVQTLDAVFHTGCDLTRLPARECTTRDDIPGACTDKTTYDPEASETARPHLFATFAVGGVDDEHSGSAGRVYYDTLSFGTSNTKNFVEVNSATVGASSEISSTDNSLVCLSMKVPAVNNSTFYDMYNAKVLTKPWLSVVFRKCDSGVCEKGGALTFGGPDLKNCDSKIDWIPALPGSHLWHFRMKSVLMKGKKVAKNVNGNVNTGNSYIGVPKVFMKTLRSRFGLRKQGDTYTKACNAKLEFVFVVDGRKIVVNEKHLILNKRLGNECVVAVTESEDLDQMFVLGSPFFRATCVVHDIGEPQRIGFAAIKGPEVST